MIDYGKINNSISHYTKFGFSRIESPWTVTEEISSVTKPIGAEEFTIKEKNKVLVASGEQSFLYLYSKGFLPRGKFQTVTPCFRNDLHDKSHKKYFIKNELINTEDTSHDALRDIVDNALKFFTPYFDKGVVWQQHFNDINQIDIVAKQNDTVIELGSYGIRECEFLKWVYGTGCAEPRLSYAIDAIKHSK